LTPEPEVQSDSTLEYEIERLVDKRKRYNRIVYRVTCKGYNASNDTWELASALHKAKDLIKEYKRNKFIVPEEELNQLLKYNVMNPHRLDGSRQCRKNNTVNIMSTKRIPEKSEVFVPYGSGYWRTMSRAHERASNFRDETSKSDR